VEIRELTETDVAGAAALWQACGLTRPWNDPAADARRAIDGATSAVLGLADGEVLLGTVMVGVDGHRGWMYYLAVDPGRRREGLGRVLVTAAEAWLRRHGAPKVQLMVRGSNTSTLAFYQRLGYTDQDVAVLGKFLDPALQRMRAQGDT